MIISRVSAVVGLDGFEPSTSRLSGARSNHLSYKPFSFGWSFPSVPPVHDGNLNPHARLCQQVPLPLLSRIVPICCQIGVAPIVSCPDKIISPTIGRCYDFGGDDGNRTHDPLLAGQVLSQLSYTPIFPGFTPPGKAFKDQFLDPQKLNNKRSVQSLASCTSRQSTTASP